MPKVYKLKDKSDSYVIKKDQVFDCPNRLIMIGKSGSGKSSLLGNLLLRDDFFKNDYEPQNIYIFSGSLDGDIKLKTIVETLQIPESNLFDSWDENMASEIYDLMVDEFNESVDNKKIPKNSLFILDDLSYTNVLKSNKKNSIIDKLYCNGRKFNISVWTTSQKFSSINTQCRENISGAILFGCSNKQLDLIEQDMNYLNNKKEFYDLYRKNTVKRNDFLVIDYSKDNIYRNMEFKSICMCKDGSNKCGGIIQK